MPNRPKLSDHFRDDLVFFLTGTDRFETLADLVRQAGKKAGVADIESLVTGVLTRERISSTGVGRQIAIPHYKSQKLDRFFIAVGILDSGIDWLSIDTVPVRVIFMIAGGEHHNEYLWLLAGIAKLVREEGFISTILSCHTAGEVTAALKRLALEHKKTVPHKEDGHS